MFEVYIFDRYFVGRTVDEVVELVEAYAGRMGIRMTSYTIKELV